MRVRYSVGQIRLCFVCTCFYHYIPVPGWKHSRFSRPLCRVRGHMFVLESPHRFDRGESTRASNHLSAI